METIITITMLLIGASNLMITAVLGLIFFYNMKNPPGKIIANNSPTASGSAPVIDEETLERKQREYREQLIAINDLMNYSSDIAYGIKPKE